MSLASAPEFSHELLAVQTALAALRARVVARTHVQQKRATRAVSCALADDAGGTANGGGMTVDDVVSPAQEAWVHACIDALVVEHRAHVPLSVAPVPSAAQYRLLNAVPKRHWPAVEAVTTPGFAAVDAMRCQLEAHQLDKAAGMLIACAAVADTTLPLFSAIIGQEVFATPAAAQLFRVNSLASKMVAHHARLVALDYVKEMCHELILHCCLSETNKENNSSASLEINPAKLAPDKAHDAVVDDAAGVNGDDTGGGGRGVREDNATEAEQELPDFHLSGEQMVEMNRYRLEAAVSLLLDHICKSVDAAPLSLRRLAHLLQSIVTRKFPGARVACLGSMLFLRFVCPTLLTTPLGEWNLDVDTSSANNKHYKRNIVLVVKVLQALANGVTFGSKEPFMQALNPYVEENLPRVAAFCDDFANPSAATLATGAMTTPTPTPQSVFDEAVRQKHHFEALTTLLLENTAAPAAVVTAAASAAVPDDTADTVVVAAHEGTESAADTTAEAVAEAVAESETTTTTEIAEAAGDGGVDEWDYTGTTRSRVARCLTSNPTVASSAAASIAAAVGDVGDPTLRTACFVAMHAAGDGGDGDAAPGDATNDESSTLDATEVGDNHPGLRAIWVADADAKVCKTCEGKFNVKKRKHHCRCCGRVFCGPCSSKKCPVQQWGFESPVRVCDGCHFQCTLTSKKTAEKAAKKAAAAK
jgi:hypothetical protein